MSTEGKASLRNSNAAMVAAMATLVTALLGVAVFLIGQFRGDGASPGPHDPDAVATPPLGETALGDTASGDPASGDPPRSRDQTVRWHDTLRLDGLTYVDWDAATPVRNPDGLTADTYVWSGSEISSPYGMVEWTRSGSPTIDECANLLATHGIGGHLDLDVGKRYCLRTDESRTVFLAVLSDTAGWEVDATVWRARS